MKKLGRILLKIGKRGGIGSLFGILVALIIKIIVYYEHREYTFTIYIDGAPTTQIMHIGDWHNIKYMTGDSIYMADMEKSAKYLFKRIEVLQTKENKEEYTIYLETIDNLNYKEYENYLDSCLQIQKFIENGDFETER